mmetsp:Transcript_90015/g.176228  ORF Transcript_90015/g.176228 Transcript_90015/m.176228 type:complete len:91 (-) Transcript_90015:297-569(-)
MVAVVDMNGVAHDWLVYNCFRLWYRVEPELLPSTRVMTERPSLRRAWERSHVEFRTNVCCYCADTSTEGHMEACFNFILLLLWERRLRCR